MMKKFTKKFPLLFELIIFVCLIFLAVYLAVGKNLSYATLEGVKLWFACVLPALFPYFFITAVLSSLSVTGKMSALLSPFTKKVFNVGGLAGFAFFTSVISGYPVGAKTVADLREKGLLAHSEAVRASALCSTSSPMFLIGSVGSVTFRSNTFGLKLFLAHFISSLIVGFIFSFYKKSEKASDSFSSPLHSKKVDNIIYESAYSAVISILVVGGLITVFYILTEVLISLNVLPPLISIVEKIVGDNSIAESLVFGVFECTRALKSLALSRPSIFTLSIASAICGFGGLSVIMQSISYLKKAKIKTAPFILSKIISAVVNFIIGLLVSLLFN